MVSIKTFSAPDISRNEILRYAGCKTENDLPNGLLDECISLAADKLTFKVCYSVLDIKTQGEVCDFGVFSFKSRNLSNNLKDCNKAVVFAATVGVGIDRLIAKYGTLSPSKSVLLDAIGTERIEALCDLFCEDIKKDFISLKPRFSPGYGDFDLSHQKDIFSLLNCQKNIGLTVTESLLMSPSKSVTAIVGVGGKEIQGEKCNMCENKDCLFRSNL